MTRRVDRRDGDDGLRCRWLTSISRKFSGGPYISSKVCWRDSGIACIFAVFVPPLAERDGEDGFLDYFGNTGSSLQGSTVSVNKSVVLRGDKFESVI